MHRTALRNKELSSLEISAVPGLRSPDFGVGERGRDRGKSGSFQISVQGALEPGPEDEQQGGELMARGVVGSTAVMRSVLEFEVSVRHLSRDVRQVVCLYSGEMWISSPEYRNCQRIGGN